MPGENRPSLASVAPYDDCAETLIAKVEKTNSRKKAKPRQIDRNEANVDVLNTLHTLTNTNEKLMKSKKVLANDGKQFERKNYVKINQEKKGKYKPAMRGAAY